MMSHYDNLLMVDLIDFNIAHKRRHLHEIYAAVSERSQVAQKFAYDRVQGPHQSDQLAVLVAEDRIGENRTSLIIKRYAAKVNLRIPQCTQQEIDAYEKQRAF